MQNFNPWAAALCALASLSSMSVHAQEGYQFFARASHLGAGEAWVTTRAHGSGPKLDMSVRKWNPQIGEWSPCHDGAAACGTNQNSLTWGQPVYAPADGEITACYRAFPDNPKPGEKLPDVDDDDVPGKPDPGIHQAGNNVWLRTDAGDMIALTHMQQWSIPKSVCPKGDDEQTDIITKKGKYTLSLYIEPSERPRVRRGQFVGLAGNSGNSAGPHVHIQHNAIINGDEPDTTLPVRFKQVYAHDYAEDQPPVWNGWYPLREDAIDDNAGLIAVHPAPFLRRTDYGIGAISEVDTVFMDDALAVTAVRNGQDKLQLTSWDCAADGIDRLEDETAGLATMINLAQLSRNLVMVALRADSGNLKMILYEVGHQGEFTRLDDYTAGLVDMIDMASYREMHAVTATRNDRSQLELTEWTVEQTYDGWQISPRGSASAGYVSALAVTGAKAFTGAAVAMRTADNTLKTIPYRIDGDGWILVRGSDRETNDPIGYQIDITALPRGFAAAGDDVNQRLKIVGYGASANGDLVGPQSAWLAGKVSRVDINTTPDAGSDVITTVRNGAGELMVISWAMTDDGRDIRRGGSVSAREFSKVATASTSRFDGGGTPRDMFLTAIRSGLGKLKLIYWDVNLAD
ncbi:MAG: M23 family metallopeptidase [Myxococcales bacterium]|nr:M23 family metallopeptidase [Myxococcales bacterium]